MSPPTRYSPAVRHTVLVAALLLLLGLTAVFAAQPLGPGEPPPAPAGAAPALKSRTVPPPTRFEAVDLIVDAGKQPLAAWQVELTGTVPGGHVRIVGIEGGESPVYAKAPYYDQRAMSQDRVIVAGLSLAPAADLPAGRTRVARVHLQVAGSELPAQYLVRMMAAANAAAEQIDAAVSAVPVENRR